MKKIANKNILKIKPYVGGRPIDEVKRELGLKDVIKLASNENAYGPSPQVIKAIAKEAKYLNRYPDGNSYYLRKALAKRLGVRENQLIFGNGSDEVIVMATRAFIEKGDEAVIAKPSFLIYEMASKIAGATVKGVPLKNFKYDLDGMKKSITKKTKIIFIGNPDNPSGTYVTKKQILDFLESIRANIIVFLDEAYFEYVTSKDYSNSLKLLKNYKNVIVTRTFSKMYGLAGLRIGYGVASAEIIDILNRVRDPFNVNSLAQIAALECLKDKKYYKNIARNIAAQRKYLYRGLKELGIDFRESPTNFILINVGRKNSLIAKKLLKKGVIVRDMDAWGVKNYIRVSIGTQKENKRLISSLKEILT